MPVYNPTKMYTEGLTSIITSQIEFKIGKM